VDRVVSTPHLTQAPATGRPAASGSLDAVLEPRFVLSASTGRRANCDDYFVALPTTSKFAVAELADLLLAPIRITGAK
jgi:hypothetical protein